PGDRTARLAELERVLELPHRILEPVLEHRVAQLGQLVPDLVRRQLAHRLRLEFLAHYASTAASSRIRNRVCSGSLLAPSRNAWRACAAAMPSSSNSTRPGLTTATHSSGFPLPLPIRVSAGFLVTGLSGNTRIHILPPRLMNRVM